MKLKKNVNKLLVYELHIHFHPTSSSQVAHKPSILCPPATLVSLVGRCNVQLNLGPPCSWSDVHGKPDYNSVLRISTNM